ncbi:MAG: segregation and condensation protein A [Acidimicrobiales bacterium]
MGATVTTPAFEGPVDLLLQLVNTHQVDLYDIPLASVVDAFVAEVAGWDTVDLQTLSEFLMIAAVLIELKSRRLLPGPDDVDPDEELIGWEERDLLLARLLECRAYASAADAFAVLAEQAARSVPRTAGLDPEFVVHAPDLLQGVTPPQVAAAFHRATAERPVPTVDLYHVTVDTVTVSDAVSEIGQRMATMGRATFRTLTRHLTARIEIIVSFLALLELFKQGRVSLDQGHTFGDLDGVGVEGAPVPSAVGVGRDVGGDVGGVGGYVDEYEG